MARDTRRARGAWVFPYACCDLESCIIVCHYYSLVFSFFSKQRNSIYFSAITILIVVLLVLLLI